MSTSPDDRLGELSATERDFLARRMPVACNVGELLTPTEPAPIDRERILRALDRLTALASRLYRRHDFQSSHNALAIERDIREALK